MRLAVFPLCLLVFPVALSAQNPPAGLTIELSFSPRAAAELARLREGVSIAAYYYGEPRRAYRRRAAEDGRITLGVEDINPPDGARRVAITGRNYQSGRASWVVTPSVDINVFSARRGTRDNILNCTLVTGSLAEVAGRVHPVRCTLLRE